MFDLDDTLADRSAAIAVYASLFVGDFAAALSTERPEDVHRALLAADDFGTMLQAQRLCAAPIWRERVPADQLFDHWAARFGEAATAFPEVRGVLDALAARGVLMGIVTNGGAAMQRAKISALGLDRYMSTIVISDEVGLRKPDAAIFKRALANLGVVAADAWFIGDNPDLDVRAAHDAGLLAFWVQTGIFKRSDGLPGRNLDRLSDLLEHLDT